jgi:Spy/CpxP family protein refolding chaperone
MSKKKFVPFMERLTPEQRKEFLSGMAKLRRRFQRKMRRGLALQKGKK